MAIAQAQSNAPANGGSKGVAGWYASAKDYIQDLQMEMRRVTWPGWKQVRATTGVVIAAIFLFAIYFAIVDFLVNKGIGKLFTSFTK
jgi:preprotein translocase subunit SecE